MISDVTDMAIRMHALTNTKRHNLIQMAINAKTEAANIKTPNDTFTAGKAPFVSIRSGRPRTKLS